MSLSEGARAAIEQIVRGTTEYGSPGVDRYGLAAGLAAFHAATASNGQGVARGTVSAVSEPTCSITLDEPVDIAGTPTTVFTGVAHSRGCHSLTAGDAVIVDFYGSTPTPVVAYVVGTTYDARDIACDDPP